MKMYFISGVSGVGKTAVMKILRPELATPYIVKDFDERGVPAGGGREWRLNETRYWITEGIKSAQNGEVLIVCGLANPEEIAVMEEAGSIDVKIILLDATSEVIIERLQRRNSDSRVKAELENTVGPVDNFIRGSSEFAPILKNICSKAGVPIIDTSHLSPNEAVSEIKKLL